MENKRYYFGVNKGWCKETCMVLNNDTKIGSVTCQDCVHCIDKDDEYDCNWIVCDVIDEATKVPNNEQKAKECDASGDDSSNVA